MFRCKLEGGSAVVDSWRCRANEAESRKEENKISVKRKRAMAWELDLEVFFLDFALKFQGF